MRSLKQIKADVVIVCRNINGLYGATLPLWECEYSTKELVDIATQFCLEINEEYRRGVMLWKVMDFRK